MGVKRFRGNGKLPFTDGEKKGYQGMGNWENCKMHATLTKSSLGGGKGGGGGGV